MQRFILVLLSFLLLNTSSLKAQTTTIPDPSFEQALINLGIDSDGLINGQILNSDAAVPTNLDIGNKNIQDLTGIQAFINLIDLNAENNSISTINLTNLVNLQTLNLHANQLSTLDVSANINLMDLDVGNNQISSLNLINNTNLEILIINNNQLTALNVSNNLNLIELVTSFNQISSLNLTANTSLEKLDITDNQLTALNTSNNVNLTELHLSNNQISSLNLTANTSLEKLDISINQFTSLNINNNLNLVELVIANNQISSLNLAAYTSLEILNIHNNQFTSLDVSSNTNLRELYISQNPIASIDVSNNTNLTLLTTDNTLISVLNLVNNTNLFSLSCLNNQLSTIDLTNQIDLQTLNIAGNQLRTLDLHRNISLGKLFCNNNQLEQIDLRNRNNNNMLSVRLQNNNSGLLICVDNLYAPILSTWQKDPTATYSDICRVTLVGSVTRDINFNCKTDPTDISIPNQIVEITNNATSQTSYSTSNVLGNYIGGIDTGVYTLDLIPWGPYWSSCLNNTQSITVDSITDLDTANWSVQPITLCPHLTVAIAAPFLRKTGGGSAYTVSYCNNGTLSADNPYIEVDLDPSLNVLGASIPIVSQNGSTYTFNIDTLDIGECGSFNINVIVDTSALAMQTHCSEAHIFPDSLCLTVWSGPVIDAKARCQNDTVFFKLKNTGSNNMLQARTYTIFEDNIIIRFDTFKIDAGDSITIAQYAFPGKTYRLQAEQEPGFPSIIGASTAHVTVRSCNSISSNTNVIPQFYTGNTSPHIAVDCQPNISSYDPNDKTPQPLGYGNQHFIEPWTPLEYRVRFQNTGNDTAFTVIVTDSLSPHLDISTLVMGASSHSYTWEIRNTNLLVVTFDNILLVDSMTNEPLSNGYFSYNISPKNNLSNGTIINNQAYIYFDFNPPILTNTTFHTIGEDFYNMRLQIDTTICIGASLFINGVSINGSGQHIDSLTALMGQDSVMVWNINADSVRSSISMVGMDLIADEDSATYQWLDCDNGFAPISGATNRTFTPSQIGNYAVEISQYNCILRSNCINVNTLKTLSIQEDLLLVHPNPTSGLIHIEQLKEKEVHISVFDNLGRNVLEQRGQEVSTKIDLSHLPNGVYFINIHRNQHINTYKVIKL